MIRNKIINHITKHGKKGVGERIWKDTLKQIQKTSLKSVRSTVQVALINAAPAFKMHKTTSRKAKRRKKTHLKEIPVFIKKHSIRMSLSMKNILSASKRSGVSTSTKLAKDILIASENKGPAIQKKNLVQEKVLTNKKYFRFYRW